MTARWGAWRGDGWWRGLVLILNSRGLTVDGSWGRARGESGSSGWTLFLRGNGRLGFGVGLAGVTEVLVVLPVEELIRLLRYGIYLVIPV